MFRFLRPKPKPVSLPDSLHDQLLARLKKIRPDKAILVHSPNRGSLVIRASYKSIQEYNHFFRLILVEMKNPKGIRPAFFQPIPQIYRLKDWFVGGDDSYLEASTEVEIFVDRAYKFVEAYIEFTKNPPPEKKPTVMGLTTIVNQIREITDCLIIVTEGEEVKKPVIPSSVKTEGF